MPCTSPVGSDPHPVTTPNDAITTGWPNSSQQIKTAVKAIADGAELSPAAAAAVVDTVVEALEQAAAAGGGVA